MRIEGFNQEGKSIGVFESAAAAGRALGIDSTAISRVASGVRNSAGQIKWFWIDDDSEPNKVITQNTSTSSSTDYPNKKVGLSAIGEDGKIMDIDQYCEHHGLPRKDISSYKLITHTGTPYYNTVFKEVFDENFNDIDFDSIVKKYLILPHPVRVPEKEEECDWSRLVYTDVHVAMDPNPEDSSIYGGKWDEDEFIRRVEEMATFTIVNSKSALLIVDELGDYMDGQGGQTIRKGHSLPQNMSDEEAFDLAVRGKVLLFDRLIGHFRRIISHNLVNDNHSGSFSYFVNSAVKAILEAKYGDSVMFSIQRKFMDHYAAGRHCFILTHGKDDQYLKYGYPVHPKPEHVSRIDEYCKSNELYRKYDFIEFSKGDSHQFILDYAASDDFDYCNYPAFSPSSGYIQTNYKKGRSGFVLQNFNEHDREKEIKYKIFNWKK